MADRRLEAMVRDLQGDVSTLMDGLNSGRLTPDDWHQAMEDLLTEGHLGAFLVASGSTEAPDLVNSPIGRYIAGQLEYLDEWRDALDPDDPRNASRGDMYATAVRGAYSIGATDGWPLPTYPGQDTDCLTRCQCEWNIVVLDAGAGDADCFWERNAEDSCDTCTANAGKYYPLRIRNGAIA